MATNPKLLARQNLERMSHDELVALVVALTPTFPEDKVEAMTDGQLEQLGQSLTTIRRETIQRAQFVQSLQDARAADLLARRRQLLIAESPLLSPGSPPDGSSVGQRPTG